MDSYRRYTVELRFASVPPERVTRHFVPLFGRPSDSYSYQKNIVMELGSSFDSKFQKILGDVCETYAGVNRGLSVTTSGDQGNATLYWHQGGELTVVDELEIEPYSKPFLEEQFYVEEPSFASDGARSAGPYYYMVRLQKYLEARWGFYTTTYWDDHEFDRPSYLKPTTGDSTVRFEAVLETESRWDVPGDRWNPDAFERNFDDESVTGMKIQSLKILDGDIQFQVETNPVLSPQQVVEILHSAVWWTLRQDHNRTCRAWTIRTLGTAESPSSTVDSKDGVSVSQGRVPNHFPSARPEFRYLIELEQDVDFGDRAPNPETVTSHCESVPYEVENYEKDGDVIGCAVRTDRTVSPWLLGWSVRSLYVPTTPKEAVPWRAGERIRTLPCASG
jgi:hypothetical protein